MAVHKLQLHEKPLWRPAYGGESERAGTEYLLLCDTHLEYRGTTTERSAVPGLWALHEADVEAAARGYKRRADGTFECLYDGALVGSMDAHDRVCTQPGKRH